MTTSRNAHLSALLLALGAATQTGCSLSVIEGPPDEDAGVSDDSDESTTSSSSDDENDDAATTDAHSTSGTPNTNSSDDTDDSNDASDSSVNDASDEVTSGTTDDGGNHSSTDTNQASTGTDSGTVESGGRGTCGADLADATVVSGLDGDTTWSGTILVTAPITVGNVELTIEPGTNVVFAADAALTIGRYNGDTSTFIAEGTEDNPIVFCGEEATPGFWSGIYIGGLTKTNSTISHVNVFDAGGKEAVAALTLAATIDVKDVVISNSASAGLSAENFGDDSARVSVTDSKTAVILEEPEAVDRFPLGGSLTGNEDNVATLRFPDIETPTTYHNLGIPYLHAEGVTVGADLTIEAGVELAFAPGLEFLVGRFNDDEGTLRVMGTESAPVVFRGQQDEPGFWRGFSVYGLASSASEIHYTTIQNAGESDYNALYVDSEILLDHITVQNNDRGVYIGWGGLDPESTNLTVTGTNEGLPLYLEPNALTSLPPDSSFTGNALDRIEILPGEYQSEGTLLNPGVPYFIASSLHVGNGSFVPAAGTQFIMGADARLTSAQYNGESATFILAGTESEPIVFSGAENTPGYWYGVTIGPAVQSTAKIEWVEFNDGGGNDGTAMLYLTQAVPVSNSTFTNSASGGIQAPSDDSTDYTESNTFSDNVGADVVQ